MALGEKSIQSRSSVSRRVDPNDFYSFVLFSSTIAFSITVLSSTYWLFILLVLIDGIATYLRSDSLVSLDRSIGALSLVVLSAVLLSFNVIYLILEVLAVVVLVDLSFLLRRFSDTKLESSIIKRRVGSYIYTMIPSFFISYALIFLYSYVFQSTNLSALVLGLSSIGSLIVIIAVVRYFPSPSSFIKGKAEK